MKRALFPVLGALTLNACIQGSPQGEAQEGPAATYLDYSGRDDVLAGGVKMIPVATPMGTFHVWTKRIGNNPSVKLLLLHGGPAATHEYLEGFDSYLPAAGRT